MGNKVKSGGGGERGPLIRSTLNTVKGNLQRGCESDWVAVITVATPPGHADITNVPGKTDELSPPSSSGLRYFQMSKGQILELLS